MSRAIDPLYVWHWARCEKCSDILQVRSDSFDADELMPGCCGGNGGVRDDRMPQSVHPTEHLTKRPLLCGDCGYEKEFGTRPARPEEESEIDMGRKKKTTDAAPAAEANGTNGTVRSEPVKREVYHQKLPCKVGAEVNAEKALELARQVHQRGVWREDWKAKCAEARETRTAFDKKIEELAEQVDGQVEYRDVETVEYLMPDNSVQVIRSDTGEVLETRVADAEDLQEPMFKGDEDEPVEPAFGDIGDPASVLAGDAAPDLDPGSADALFGR